MTTEDLIKLRGLAEAATPGEWVAKKWTSEEGETYGWNFAVNGYRLPLCEMETDNPNECDANAAYIAAANPAKVIELLDALEALSAEVERQRTVNADQYGALDLASRECSQLRAQLEARGEAVAWVPRRIADGYMAWEDASKDKGEPVNGALWKRVPLYTHPAPAAPVVDRVRECAQRLVEHADFQLGGILSADSKAKDIPSNATSAVKARHLAALRDALHNQPKGEQA